MPEHPNDAALASFLINILDFLGADVVKQVYRWKADQICKELRLVIKQVREADRQ